MVLLIHNSLHLIYLLASITEDKIFNGKEHINSAINQHLANMLSQMIYKLVN